MHPFTTLIYALLSSNVIYAVVIFILANQTPGTETIGQIVSGVFIIIAAMHRKLLLPFRQEKIKELQDPQAKSPFFIFGYALLESSAIYLLVSGLLSIFLEPIPSYTVLIPVIVGAIASTYVGINAFNALASEIPVGDLFSNDQHTATQHNQKLIKTLLPAQIVGIIGLIISLALIMQ